MKTTKQISFGKGTVISKKYFTKSKSKLEIEQNPSEPTPVNFVEFIIQFNHIMPVNLSKAALGGVDPQDFSWTIEVEPFSQFSYNIMRTNILEVCLNPKHKGIKDAIITLMPPSKAVPSRISELQLSFGPLLSTLNDEQQMAVLKSILANNYHMVLGTPGSGKTTAIVVLLKILAKMKKRVLVVSFTNSAIDIVLSRLKDSGFNDFVRVTSNLSSVDQSIHSNVKTNKCFQKMSQIQETIDNNYIYGATCLSTSNILLSCLNFDFCIMDEASQISEPLAIGPILLAEKFIMIGDYHQLNPLVKSRLAGKKGMGTSLFEKLCKGHPDCTTVLKKQFRMNKEILELSN